MAMKKESIKWLAAFIIIVIVVVLADLLLRNLRR